MYTVHYKDIDGGQFLCLVFQHQTSVWRFFLQYFIYYRGNAVGEKELKIRFNRISVSIMVFLIYVSIEYTTPPVEMHFYGNSILRSLIMKYPSIRLTFQAGQANV